MESYRKNSEKYLKIDLLLKEIDNLENVLEKKLNSNTKKVDELEDFHKQVMNDYKKIIDNLTNTV